jgi:L-threonylcarbamoyladenylate synthase
VVIDRAANTGEGLIAWSEVTTPEGVIRLSSPESVEDYAHSLYSSLRKGDSQGLSVIVVIPPSGDGLAAAIRDRIIRASAN